jgi:hypothetical protein
LINNAAQTVRRPAGFYTHMMANEELPINELPKQAQELLQDHLNCLEELKVLTSAASSNENMPVTWHGPEPGIGLRASAKLSQIPYPSTTRWLQQKFFLKENSMPICNK